MALVAGFRVARVVRAPLQLLWQFVREDAGVSRSEFDAYFVGLRSGVGIWITDVVEFCEPVPLADLRAIWRGFHPPQGFRYLESADIAKLPIRNRRQVA